MATIAKSFSTDQSMAKRDIEGCCVVKGTPKIVILLLFRSQKYQNCTQKYSRSTAFFTPRGYMLDLSYF